MSMQQSEARRERLREERAEARRLGVKVTKNVVIDKSWTDFEDDTVRRLFPDYQALITVLRHRSYSSLRRRARHLKLVKEKRHWTVSEEKLLISMWAKASAKDLCLAFPGRARDAITNHGHYLGLPRRGKPPLALTGNWLCDAIRDRCRELGYSMAALDEMAETGSYFYRQGWHSPTGHAWPPMIKAAKMLGGELRVEWPD